MGFEQMMIGLDKSKGKLNDVGGFRLVIELHVIFFYKNIIE